MYTVVSVGAVPGSECDLVLSDNTAVLVEAGCSFSAPGAVQNIKKALNGRKLDAILLTHSHFDHAAGSPVIKKEFPEAQVVASTLAAKILQKPTARKVIRELDIAAAKSQNKEPGPDTTEDLVVDVQVDVGDKIRIGDMDIRVLSGVGHTNCSVCFLFEQEGLLVACETLGITPDYPEVQPCFVVSYRATRESIDNIRKLKPKHVLVTHYGMIPDEGIEAYFENAVKVVDAVKDLVLDGYKQGKDLEQIITDYRKLYYDGTVERIQSEDAMRANVSVMVPRVLAEYGYTLGERS